MSKNDVVQSQDHYKYGFNDEDVSVYKTEQGLTRETILEISKIKKEPEWMLEFRLKAYDHFMSTPMPTWGADLSRLNFDDYVYYIKPSTKVEGDWEDVPDTIKTTFDRLGIP